MRSKFYYHIEHPADGGVLDFVDSFYSYKIRNKKLRLLRRQKLNLLLDRAYANILCERHEQLVF